MNNKTKVLVIDDDPFLEHALQAMLPPDKYAVASAPDVETGLLAAAREIPQLIVSDMKMPRLSGLDLIAAVRSSPDLRHVPILICSAQSPSNEQECLELGANAYLKKPIDTAALRLKILALLGHPA